MTDTTENLKHRKEFIDAMDDLIVLILLTSENGSWKEVDTQEFMDEIRGRDDD